MNSQLTIRPARPSDQPALVRIVWDTVLVDAERNAEIIANPDAVEVPVDQLEPETGCVAEVDGAVVGFATVVPRADGAAELDGLFVMPHLQRGGIGRALVAAVRQLALRQGARRLHVTAGPDAVAFYRAVGFIEVGVTQTRFGPAPLMELDLAAS